jgi:hypothetical protein
MINKTTTKILYAMIVIFIILISACAFNYEYQQLKKYFPGLTIWEYMILKDKLRIVPT